MENIEQKRARNREYMQAKRAAAKASGVGLPGDGWAERNAERHRENVARWRAENPGKSADICREAQKRRRSTPWGAINSRIWPIMHKAVRGNSARRGKYTDALGYLWSDLRMHVEAQFTGAMSWGNWGALWELDHKVPISDFKYADLSDPLFKQAWALSNLRPLLKEENAAKGCKHLEFT